MKHQYIFELCIVLFYARLISSASVTIRNRKVNVDEFLKTVMNSEKFDEIAEKIADKAVEKFSKLNNVGNFSGNAAYRVSEVETKEPKNSDPNHDTTVTEKQTTQREVVRKIDTEAFMKKESEDPLNHLSLKYNQFTKSSNTPKSKKRIENTDVEEAAISKDTTEEKSLEEENKQFEQRMSASKFKQQESDVDIPKIKIKSKNTDRTKPGKFRHKKKIRTTTPQDNDGSESSYEKDSQNGKSMAASDQNEDESKKLESEIRILKAKNKGDSDDINNEGSSEADSSNKDNIKNKENNEEESDDEYKVRTPAYEYLKLPETSNDSEKIKKRKKSLEANTSKQQMRSKLNTKVKEKQNGPDKSKPDSIPVFKEGNKLFTYEKSPDYEDYHNEIRRIQNQLIKVKKS